MENILVGIIVALAVVYLVRNIYKGFTGEQSSCGCGCSGCGMNPEACQENGILAGMPEQGKNQDHQ